MSSTRLVVGAPAWDRAWSLSLWFDSVRANCDPAETGLLFVVPAADAPTRDAISRLSEGFRWVEVLRDRGEQSGREERPATNHLTLAQCRNQILQKVNDVQPKHFISWDTDLLVSAETVPEMRELRLPCVTNWTWLNRQPPRVIKHFDGQDYHEVLYDPPIRMTAMGWDKRYPGRAVHYPAHEFSDRDEGLWKCGVTLAFQVMDRRAYSVAHYAPHPDGEDVTFSWQLQQRGVERWCLGENHGVHLYDRTARDEIKLGWPKVMELSRQRPLAADWTEPRSPQYTAFGFFPRKDGHDSNEVAA